MSKYFNDIEVCALRSGLGGSSSGLNHINRCFYKLADAISWAPDGVIISSPATRHLTEALHFARLGVPLLIEKPIGTGLEPEAQWDELKLLSVSVPILVGYVLRYDPCVEFVKHQVLNKSLGRIVEADFYCGSWLPSWRPKSDYRRCVSSRKDLGGGVLYELSHEIDMAQWLLGPLKLHSCLLNSSGLLDTDVEDHAILSALTDEERCLLSIRLNFCTRLDSRVVTLKGETAQVVCDLLEGIVKISYYDDRADLCFRSKASVLDRYIFQMKHFLFYYFNMR